MLQLSSRLLPSGTYTILVLLRPHSPSRGLCTRRFYGVFHRSNSDASLPDYQTNGGPCHSGIFPRRGRYSMIYGGYVSIWSALFGTLGSAGVDPSGGEHVQLLSSWAAIRAYCPIPATSSTPIIMYLSSKHPYVLVHVTRRATTRGRCARFLKRQRAHNASRTGVCAHKPPRSALTLTSLPLVSRPI